MNVEYRNQSLPFRKPIHRGLPVDCEVQLDCIPFHGSQKTFYFEYTSTLDTILRVEVNLDDQNGILLSTRNNGVTDYEEWLPRNVEVGQKTELRVTAQDMGFEISLNGQHLRDFNYRHSLRQVSSLKISGDIRILCVRFRNFNDQLEPPKPGCDAVFRMARAAATNSRLPIPALSINGVRGSRIVNE
ncbi:hypothetical protein M3Y94_00259600 [Aphelenchoides besseyi]|nr:hypothetical protein M3Y94_00259600 [Aphelenchoides besseyi]KAI6236185.1 hypothetical protein M3Y95_00130800 [Aphelenchoides besseyi]